MIRAEIKVTLFRDDEELGSAMEVVRQSHCLTEEMVPTIFLADVSHAAMIAARAANALRPTTAFYPYTG